MIPNAADPVLERNLVYWYAALVILEGPLRKWFLPEALGPLTAIARDPIAIVLLWQGYRRGLLAPLWLRDFWLLTALGMGGGGLLAMLGTTVPLDVWAYGLRTNLLHLPLILIIPALLTPGDLQLLLKRLLLLALPIALLMLWQYRSPIDSWINKSVLEGVMQIRATSGKVRPPGPFSFITGATEYFSFITAVFLGGLLDRRFPNSLIIYGLASSLLALSVSGSRLMQASLGVVWVGTLLVAFLSGRKLPSANALVGGIAAGLVLVLLINLSPLGDALQEGWQTTNKRITDANAEDGGVITRIQSALTIPERILWQAPVLGYGLGLGTNYGTKATKGTVGFSLSESELQRLLLESGLYIGGLFLLFRNALALHVGLQAWWALGQGIYLPISLFFAGVVGLSFGQIRLPTTMGFLVLAMAFALSAVRCGAVPPDPKAPPR